jgi:phospholipase/lecithinase/hemolysin
MKYSIALMTAVLLAAPISSAQAGGVKSESVAELAGPFSAVYLFGDSLTDTGDVAAQLPVDEIPQALPGQETSFYWEGSFCNGPNWADQMAKALGTTASPSLLGGTNYARGGAHNVRPNPDPAFAVLFGDAGFLLSEQIDEYLTSGPPGDPDALYVVWMGSNDAAVGGATDPAPGVAEVSQAVQDLYATGARQFLVWGLYPFVVPGFEGIEAYARGFNALLPGALDELEQTLPGIVITRGDYVAALGPILDDPAAFGFTNAGGFFEPTACTALGFPAPPVGGDPACQAETLTDTFFGRPIGDTYLFHDGIHFTTAVHEYWSDHALTELCKTRVALESPGDSGGPRGMLLCER